MSLQFRLCWDLYQQTNFEVYSSLIHSLQKHVIIHVQDCRTNKKIDEHTNWIVYGWHWIFPIFFFFWKWNQPKIEIRCIISDWWRGWWMKSLCVSSMRAQAIQNLPFLARVKCHYGENLHWFCLSLRYLLFVPAFVLCAWNVWWSLFFEKIKQGGWKTTTTITTRTYAVSSVFIPKTS